MVAPHGRGLTQEKGRSFVKRFLPLVAILTGAVLFVCGCDGGGSDDDDSDEAAAPAADNAPAPAPAPESDPAPDANEAFASITPSGLQGDRFTIVGRGTVYTFSCNAVPGAVRYTFTSIVGSATVEEPTWGTQGLIDGVVDFTVYATNAEGVNTRTASGSTN